MSTSASGPSRFQLVVGGVLVAAIIGLGAVGLVRSLATGAGPGTVQNWRAIADGGVRVDSTAGPVTVTLFSDYQCPYCRQAWATLRSEARARPGTFTLVVRHFPLQQHAHAFRAALAGECAAQRDRFEVLSDTLFANQEHLGERPWESFSRTAGFETTEAFTACLHAPATVERVMDGLQAGRAAGVDGTPVMLVDDVLYKGIVGPAELHQRIDRARSARMPTGDR